jgi:UDP-2-acetamido-3-amino-2,3-dideoxy-glucuronate N-acetyltransferase
MYRPIQTKKKGDGVMRWKPELSNISDKATIGEGTIVHSGCHIHDYVVIGENCKIQAQVFIPNGVTIEDNVFVGPMVCFTNDPSLGDDFKPVPTLILRDAKIGANATIKAGVIIGVGAIIGMGSVVLNDVPANQVWVGNPAKYLRDA